MFSWSNTEEWSCKSLFISMTIQVVADSFVLYTTRIGHHARLRTLRHASTKLHSAFSIANFIHLSELLNFTHVFY